MSTAIDIRGIVKTFPNPGGGTAIAVDNVSLRIEPGELFFLLGPSGCGKTTLLRMVAGFIDPTAGAILFSGGGDAWRDITHVPPNKRNTGMVFQSYALWPHMTVEQNVVFGLQVRKIPAAEQAARVADALAAVRMSEYARRKPNQLSGGQQQRVALARALVVRPDVLLLDEPLSNLDAKLRVELRGEIRRVCKQAGITGIYVTHDQKEALSMADRIAIMSKGRVIQVGQPRQLYARPRSRFVAEFLGETNFIEGTLADAAGPDLAVATKLGTIRAHRHPDAGPWNQGQRVVVSIRPEALRLTAAERPGSNHFAGVVDETVYLGELAQHAITLPAGLTLRAAEFNPAALPKPRQSVTLAVDPADVAIVPADA